MKTSLIVLLVVVVLCVPSAVLAHKPLLVVEDNEDGTIYVETGFSDGSSGAGHKLILRDKETGDVLLEFTIPEEGYFEEIQIPKVPYTVNFNAGPGHIVVKDGPFSGEAAVAAEEAAPVEETAPVAVEEEKVDVSTEKKAVEAPATPPQTAPVPERVAETTQPVQQPVTVLPSGVAAQSVPVSVMATTAMSPGMDMALKMAVTSQMISALGVLIVLGAVMFLLGYMVGKDTRRTRT